MNHRLILQDKLSGFHRLLERFTWEPVEGHYMVPDPRFGRHLKIALDHALLGMLVHEVQDPFISRLHPIVERATACLGCKIPHGLVL